MTRRHLNWALHGESRSAIVRTKVQWADHHRGLFHEAFKAFVDSRPYLVSEDRQTHEGREYRVLSAHPDPAPDDIGLIVGDFVQNLRGALDYLIGDMRPDGPSRNSAFPIVLRRPEGPHGFRKRQCVALGDIPDEAVKVIHWMQPYHRTKREGGFRDALRVLEVLWNIAKHRSLFVVTAATAPHYVGRERAGEEGPNIGFRMSRPDHGSEIWLPITEPQEKFDPHFTVHVTLAKPRGFADDWVEWINDWEINGLVDYLHRVVRHEVIPQFNPFLKQT